MLDVDENLFHCTPTQHTSINYQHYNSSFREESEQKVLY